MKKRKKNMRLDWVSVLLIFFSCVIIYAAVSGKNKPKLLKDMTLEELEEELKYAVKEEDYIYAATIRDFIKIKKRTPKKQACE